jgi:hypothetical protein
LHSQALIRNSAKVTLSERASKRVLSLPWGDFCIIALIQFGQWPTEFSKNNVHPHSLKTTENKRENRVSR